HTRSKRDWSSDVCSSDLPGAVVTALFIRMAKLDLASTIGVTRVVAAGVIHRIGIRAAVGLRTGQDVVRIGHVTHTVHDALLFRQIGRASCRERGDISLGS